MKKIILPMIGTVLFILYYIALLFMASKQYHFVGNYAYLIPCIIFIIFFVFPLIILGFKNRKAIFTGIRKYTVTDSDATYKFEFPKFDNSISNIITITAWIIIVGGIIGGLIIAFNSGTYNNEFSFPIAFTAGVSSIVTGIVFLGFAEIISLLKSIDKKIK